MDKIDWSQGPNVGARQFVQKDLAIEQVDGDLDDSDGIFEDDRVPWAVLLRVNQ